MLLAEAVLRAVSPPRHLVWRPGLAQRFRPAPGVMPGVSGESEFRIGPLGLRGDAPPPRGPRALALGGSATECLYLDEREAWPWLLQNRLGAGSWVGNAGRSGLDSRHHRLQVPALLDEIPGVGAIVVLAGANDLLRRLELDERWRPTAWGAGGRRRELLAEAFEVLPPERGAPPWRLTALGVRAGRVLRAARGAPAQDQAGGVYAVWRAHRRGAPELRAALPDLGAALAEYRRNLRALAAEAERRGVRVVLATQPALWRAGLPADLERRLWMGGVGRYQREPGRPYYSAAALRRGLDAFDRVLLGSCAGLAGATCFDLGGAVPADGRYLYDDVHLNEAGSRLVARLLAPVVAAALAGPRPGDPRRGAAS